MNFFKSATLLIIVATLIWGGTPAIMKLTLQEVPVFSLAFIRMFFASLVLGPLVYKGLKIRKADYKTFVFAALSGVTFNIGFFFFGLKLAPAINAALLVAAVPVLTLIIAHFLLKEKLNMRLIAGSVLAVIGLVVIVGLPDQSTNFRIILGNIFLLLSALTWVFHEIFAKKLFRKYDPATVAFYSMAIGAITFMPMALYEFVVNPFWFENVTTKGFLGILYGIFGASLIAYWAWQKGLSKMPAGHASFFFYIDPISGAILAVLLLGEKVTPQLLIGGSLIAIAVGLVEIHRKNHPLHRS